MNKDDIFTMASAQDVPVDSATLADIEMTGNVAEVRQLIRMLIRECYGWPVEKERSLYGVKHQRAKSKRDPKNSAVRLPKGASSRDSGQ